MKTAAEINAEKIEAVLAGEACITLSPYLRRMIARKIVEAFPQLQQQAQYTSKRDSTSRPVITMMPWVVDNRKRFTVPTE